MMRFSKPFLLLCIICALTSSCSYKLKGKHNLITFYNESSLKLYVHAEPVGGRYDMDTIVYYAAFDQEMYTVQAHSSNDRALKLREWGTFESKMNYCSTYDVYVWNTKDVYRDDNGCLQGKNDYMVRYDLTLDDMFLLDWMITFPPDERMQGVKMWPPYEEVVAKYGNL